ncbi:mucin-5AC-like isoform X2 [Anopheles albimanus]|uniref:mucin-5AC-like isoform X2 n=1 Tax=Anopheles albimanus TaxID=7167 RepID=UPI0016411F0E|nr:mucin-5AC-like isoform X2 [Anopheles albimanus]
MLKALLLSALLIVVGRCKRTCLLEWIASKKLSCSGDRNCSYSCVIHSPAPKYPAKMGNGMNKVMPGLYIGNYRDSKDFQQLDRHGITHIVSIHDSPRRFHPDKHYLCVIAADKPDQNLSQYFSVCNDFIHSARLKQGNVLIHCLAGMSRSVTVAVAYIMAVTPLSWKEALKVVRAGRSIANPNLGFQNQLQEFETNKLLEERKRLKERFPSLALESSDREQCYLSLDYYEELLESKGVCEGHCKFGKDCPTGICRQDSRGGGGSRVNRKSSLSSKKQYNTSLSTSPSSSSQLSVRSVGAPGGAQSCPTSPRCGKASAQRRSTGEPGSGTAGSRNPDNPRAAGEYAAEIDIGELSELRRSSSIVSTYRPRSSPAGLYSYTGSAPPSIHGSRVDLSGGVSGGTGSAIYLGSSSGSGSGGAGTGSSPGPCRRLSMRSTPKSTPESSPKASPKKSATTPGKMAASASPKKTATGTRKGSSSVSGPSPSNSSSSGGGVSSSPAAMTTAQPAKKEPNATSKPTSKTTVPSNNNTVITPTTTTTSTDKSTTSTTTSTTTTTTTIAASTVKITTTTGSARRSDVPPTRTPSIVIDIGANRPDCVTASTGKAKKDMNDGFSTKDAAVEGVVNANRKSDREQTTASRQTVTSNNTSNRVARKE